MIYAVYIISKSGSLLYHKCNLNNTPNTLASLDSNDHLVMASNLHSIHAIASKLARTSQAPPNASIPSSLPGNRSGLKRVRTDLFDIILHQTVTGLKIVLVVSKNNQDNLGHGPNVSIDTANNYNYNTIDTDDYAPQIKKIYSLYSDYVLKNPFYLLDMPIRIPMFDTSIDSIW
ncbi:uncharacterized protein C5L36_0B09500 [Pichia kudriavzevii]|uniref:Trafficking protein particle complex subunit n=1 Tax=Pichia kudriavzevii TaxID=4909 RepID=A0A2U9R3Q1_PICKU|nr:uncharacterized protein C5L36_0B09500 [Pichia kudriavzevii]AWU75709.1 hypothetical protein C5L36_0B09500 [Pichia kudriavzevii]